MSRGLSMMNFGSASVQVMKSDMLRYISGGSLCFSDWGWFLHSGCPDVINTAWCSEIGSLAVTAAAAVACIQQRQRTNLTAPGCTGAVRDSSVGNFSAKKSWCLTSAGNGFDRSSFCVSLSAVLFSIVDALKTGRRSNLPILETKLSK